MTILFFFNFFKLKIDFLNKCSYLFLKEKNGHQLTEQ